MKNRPELKPKNNFFATFKNNPMQLMLVFVVGGFVAWLQISSLHASPRDKDISHLTTQVTASQSVNSTLDSSKEPEKEKLKQYIYNLEITDRIHREMIELFRNRIRLDDILLQGGYIDEITSEFVKVDEDVIAEIKTHRKEMDEEILSLEARLKEKRKSFL